MKLKTCVYFCAIFLFYFISALYSLKLDAVSGFATLVWPPTGVALAATLIFGVAHWPAIFLAAFSVNYVVGASFFTALGIGIGNTLEALVAAYLLLKIRRFNFSMEKLKNVIAFILIATFLAPVISATIGVTSLWLGGVKLESFTFTWQAWWIGDALGNLLITPLFLVLSQKNIKQIKSDNTFEIIVFTLLLLFVGGELFFDLAFTLGIPHVATLPYVLFPFVIYAAIRFNQTGNVVTVFIISLMATFGTIKGFGPFSHGSLRENLILLQSFMSVIALTGMTLAASVCERKKAIEEKKIVEENLIKSHLKLEKAVKLRDEFLSIASHELKTPITSLNLQIQMTKKKINTKENIAPTPAKLVQVLDISGRQVDRLTYLINDLLDISRIQTGKFNFKFEKVDLSQLLADIMARFSEQFKDSDCSFEVKIQEGIIGYFDHIRIEQVVSNLLSNAIKYAPKSRIKVELKKSDETAYLVIADNGPGIPHEKQVKIFERYERATSMKNTEGLGLGLYIAREIVESHKGNISLDSALGEGSRFTVELPLYVMNPNNLKHNNAGLVG